MTSVTKLNKAALRAEIAQLLAADLGHEASRRSRTSAT